MKKVACASSATIAAILPLAGYSFGSAAAREPTAKEAPSVKTASSTLSTRGHAHAASAETTTPNNKTPEGLLALLGERIKTKDLKGKVHGRTASIMGDYTLEQTGPDGTRVSFTGNFCDSVREQPNGKWLYLQDNPYPRHGGTHS